jgi:hypothetical protein
MIPAAVRCRLGRAAARLRARKVSEQRTRYNLLAQPGSLTGPDLDHCNDRLEIRAQHIHLLDDSPFDALRRLCHRSRRLLGKDRQSRDRRNAQGDRGTIIFCALVLASLSLLDLSTFAVQPDRGKALAFPGWPVHRYS